MGWGWGGMEAGGGGMEAGVGWRHGGGWVNN